MSWFYFKTMSTLQFNDVARLASNDDNIAIATQRIERDTLVEGPLGQFKIQHTILEGHRFVLVPINSGQPLLSWALPFGTAIRAVNSGCAALFWLLKSLVKIFVSRYSSKACSNRCATVWAMYNSTPNISTTSRSAKRCLLTIVSALVNPAVVNANHLFNLLYFPYYITSPSPSIRMSVFFIV